MSINWHLIRSLNNSQNNAFEELVCQLAREEQLPNKKEFYRIGAPDGGVEAYCTLNTDDEYGWQAKFFSSMGPSQWSQLTDSFRTALSKHPRLIKYYICMPLDRQDPRIDSQKWFMDKWLEYVNIWEDIAKSSGRKIEFEFWGSSELLHRLSQEKHAGRKYFWFSQDDFSDEWFKHLIENSILNLGKRYTPELNFELQINEYFNALSNNIAHKENIRKYFNNFFVKTNRVYSHIKSDPEFGNISDKLKLATDILKTQFYISQKNEQLVLDIKSIQLNIKIILEAISEYKDIISQPAKNSSQDSIQYSNYIVSEASIAINDFYDFISHGMLLLTNTPKIALVGEAGVGKSHLLADVAAQRIKNNIPCILLLGQHFNDTDAPWTQILKNILRLNCNERDFLGAINAKAEACGERILFIIDGINEGKGIYIWPEYIHSFINDFCNYPWVSLVISIRSSYENIIFQDFDCYKKSIFRLEHQGFVDVEYEASSLFFSQYNIEQPTIPLLHPEFSNPLFLKIFCEGLNKAGLRTIPKSHRGFTKIIDFFLESIDKKLSHPSRFDYPCDQNIVRKVVNSIVEEKIKSNTFLVTYERAFELTENILKKYTNKRRFLDALISEGVFSKNMFWKSQEFYEECIYLSYERFEDYFIAEHFFFEVFGTESAVFTIEKCQELVATIEKRTYRQGVIEAISIILPEKTGTEIYEVVDEKDLTNTSIVQAFMYSLVWRDTGSIKDKILNYINKYILHFEDSFDLFFQTCYAVATTPGHILNADRLHSFLMKYQMADRDAFWTIYLHDQYYHNSSFKRLIDWSSKTTNIKHISAESRLLAAKALSWIFCTTHIVFRDNATLALTNLLENNIPIITDLLIQFDGVTDQYIYERILAAAYGAVLRSDDLDGLDVLCNHIVSNLFQQEEVYPNILIRDYGRNIVEYAVYLKKFTVKNINIIRPPYKSSFPSDLPTNEEIDKYKFDYNAQDFKKHYWSQNAIINSMTTEYGRGTGGYGDFGRYTFESCFRCWECLDAQSLSNYACKLIFDKYGYNVSKHGEFDLSASSGDRHTNKKERIGKKYQWLSLYETLARVSDNFKMTDETTRWGDDKKFIQFSGPWQVYIRNIDPSYQRDTSNFFKELNFSKNENYTDWDGNYKNWLTRTDHLPDIKKLISIKNIHDNSDWLYLEHHCEWTEPAPIGHEYGDYPLKHLWYQIESYFIKTTEANEFISWAKKSKLADRDLPSPGSTCQVFSLEYFWSPAYKSYENPYYLNTEFIRFGDKNEDFIGNIMPTTESYAWESSGGSQYKQSFLAPRKFMFEKMKLCFSRKPGYFIDNSGEVICFDGHEIDYSLSFLCKKSTLLGFLKENDLKIVWICKGEKQIYGNFYTNDKIQQWLDIFSVISLEDKGFNIYVEPSLESI